MDTLGPAKSVLIFQVSLHNNISFGTTARCMDYAGVHIFKCPVLINRFHCITVHDTPECQLYYTLIGSLAKILPLQIICVLYCIFMEVKE